MSAAEKNKLRSKFLAFRKSLDVTVCSRLDSELQQKFVRHPMVCSSMHVCCYVSFESEINTLPIISTLLAQGKMVSIPRIISKKEGMEMVNISSLNDLKAGKYGILAPSNELPPITKSPDIILVPGLLFDVEGFRIGYGGGFYDRYLANNPLSYTIALAYKQQMVQSLPREPFDISVNEILHP